MRDIRRGKDVVRWMAALLAVVMLAAACGDDGGPSPFDALPSDTSSSDPSPSDTSPSDDGSTDSDSDGDMDSDDPVTGTSLDCAEIEAAIEAAGDFTALDPTGGSDAENLEASFAQSRAALAALGESAPEISRSVDEALEGLDALGAIFADLNWSTDFSSNPDAGMQLAAAMGDGDIIGMIGAMQAISTWIAETCTP